MKHIFNECVPVTVQIYTEGQYKMCDLCYATWIIKKNHEIEHKNQDCPYNQILDTE